MSHSSNIRVQTVRTPIAPHSQAWILLGRREEVFNIGAYMLKNWLRPMAWTGQRRHESMMQNRTRSGQTCWSNSNLIWSVLCPRQPVPKIPSTIPMTNFLWRHSYVSLSDSSQLMTSKNNICLSWICVCIALDRAYGPNWPFRFRFYSFLYSSKLLCQFFTVGLCRFKMWDAITFVVITRLCQLNKGENKSFNL